MMKDSRTNRRSKNEVSVFTFNFAFQKKLSKRRRLLNYFIDQVVDMQPDIICLQEIVLPSETKILHDKLSSHNYCTTSTNGRLLNRTGLFLASKIPLLDHELIFYKTQNSKKGIYGFGNLFLKMGLLSATINVDGRKLNVVNTHLQYPYSESSPNSVHKHQIEDLLSRLRTNMPTIITGDLNITPDSQNYKNLIGTDLVDASKNITHTYFPSRYLRILQKFGLIHPNKAKLDYIFHSKDLRSKNTKSVTLKNLKGQPLSDHDGLFTNIIL